MREPGKSRLDPRDLVDDPKGQPCAQATNSQHTEGSQQPDHRVASLRTFRIGDLERSFNPTDGYRHVILFGDDLRIGGRTTPYES